MNILVLLIIVLLVLGTGSFYVGPYAGYGHPFVGPGLGTIVVIILILALFGRL